MGDYIVTSIEDENSALICIQKIEFNLMCVSLVAHVIMAPWWSHSCLTGKAVLYGSWSKKKKDTRSIKDYYLIVIA